MVKYLKNKAFLVSTAVIASFSALMFYSLQHDPNFTPSQLVGKPAPTINAKTYQGENFFSQKLFAQGRWVIVNFWSTSCYVCRSEASELEYFYTTVTLANHTAPYLLSINIEDNAESISEWQKNYAQSFPVIQDQKGLISVNFGVTGTPETFFINPNGIVKYRIAGAVDKNTILKFISWFDANPEATENEAKKALIQIKSMRSS